GLLAREVLGLRRLVQTADAAPDVELPREVDVDLVEVHGRGAEGRDEHRVAPAGPLPAVVDLGEELRARDPGPRRRLLDPRRRDLGIVTLGEGLVDELDEDGIVEDLPPRLVGERRGRRRRTLDVAIDVRNRDRRLLVVWTDRAAGEKAQD